ncbi:MAG: hypothetical protein M5U19_00240 [Microthrixaceae bacterium]|nr:hypothetical protein [Microthrixaceae bacterium]
MTTTTYTKRGEVHTIGRTGEHPVEYGYYDDGTVQWVDDGLDNRTSFTYDNRGRREHRTDPNLEVWVTDYNPAGELASETDPLSRSTTYSYDDAGRLEQTVDPSGRSTTNVWHTDGLLDSTSSTDGTNTLVTDHTYDAATGRLTATTIGADTWTYAYHANGDLKSVGVS